MKKVVRIARNAVVAKLIEPTPEVKSLITGLLSYEVEGGLGWSGKSSFFDVARNTFPAGFSYLVQQELQAANYNVQPIVKPPPVPLGSESPIVDEFGNDDPRYDYQMKALRQVEKFGAGIIRVATGGGKCLGEGTPVMLWSGVVKPVEEVKIGDLLMGPDSKPRLVLSTCKGRSPLYRVTPTRGDPYVVNDAHILSLKKTSRGHRGRNRDGEKYPKGEIVNINVEDYLAETSTFRHIHKGWRTGVDFAPAAMLPVDPYFVGLLLGDGTINGTVSLTTADPEMVEELDRQAAHWGLKVTGYEKSGSENRAQSYHLTAGRVGNRANPLTHVLRNLGLGKGEKFVPETYRTASREDRLALLAGIIDTDGYHDGKGFYVTLKSERLLDDVIFIARSLGFAAYKKAVKKICCNNGKTGDCFATMISGHLDQVPVRLERRKAAPRLQKKDPLVTGLSVEPIGEGDYYGFEIDGDHLFLLGDFTVTHNTKIAKLIMARYRRPTLFITTRGILLYQMKDQVDELGMNTGVIGDGQFRAVRGVNLGMVQTLVQSLKEPTLDEERRKVVKSLYSSKKRGREAEKVTEAEIVKEAQVNYERRVKRRNAILKFLEMIEVVIGEEAHEVGGESYYDILKLCKNASIRVALTATPFMRSSTEDNMRLMAAFGPVLINIPEKLLIDRGILAKPFFKFVDSKPHSRLFKTSGYERAIQYGYTENENMHADAIADALKARTRGLPVLGLLLRVKHGETLIKAYKAAGLSVEFLRGENDQETRKRQLNQLSQGKLDVLIGTTVLDVGVDVPSIGLLQLLGGGKAEVALRQRVGRALRAKKTGPNAAFIADYTCNMNVYLRDHARQRHALIEATPGFVEGMLKPGQDFPWEAFDKTTA